MTQCGSDQPLATAWLSVGALLAFRSLPCVAAAAKTRSDA